MAVAIHETEDTHDNQSSPWDDGSCGSRNRRRCGRASAEHDARRCAGLTGLNQGAITSPKAQLSAAQKTAIYNAVSRDKSKVVAPGNFRASIGAPVPPSIELYALPSEAVANAQAASSYRYTMVNNQVVLVDPLTMQVVDIIAR